MTATINRHSGSCQGFTLIEALIVILISSLLIAMAGRFLVAPIQSYISGVQRAELVDIADISERRIVDEVRNALPNSLRQPNLTGASLVDTNCLEFLPIVTLGRYRFDQWATDADKGDSLDFTQTDLSFDVMGFFNPPPAPKTPATQNWVVINHQGVSGINDAYRGDNIGIYSSYNAGNIRLSASSVAYPSEKHRFFVIPNSSVIYFCNSGKLYRDNRNPASPTPACPSTPSPTATVLADHVSRCVFNYSGINLVNGLLSVLLQLTDDNGETLSLTREINVYNNP